MSQLLSNTRPWRLLLLGIVATLATPHALSQSVIAAPATDEAVTIPGESLPERDDVAIAEGLELESLGRWGDAVAHYERALRKTPTDRRLERRFDFAKLNNSLMRRYADGSFVETVQSLDSRSALDMHAELLAKIESHYVVNPPWTRLARRGAHAMLVAARDEAFQKQHQLRASDDQIESFRQELGSRLLAADEVRNVREALRVTSDLSQLGQQRLGVPAAAWTMEFVSAAAGGLDNYSSFLTPGQLRDVYAQIEGNFVGLGVELKADDGALLIIRVIPGSPAQRANLKAGDRITAVDGQQTAELSTDEAASLLTGEEGSYCYVTIAAGPAGDETSPAGVEDLAYLAAKPAQMASTSGRTIRVRREHVDVPSIEGARIVDTAHHVAYIRVPVFQKSTSRDVEAALWDLHRQGMRKLVIDLRGNPGGLLTSAVELADKFVAEGNLVSTRGRSDGEDFDYRAHRAGTWRVPLVVLIDGDSASASEIFAAAMLDNHRAKIVGDRSFGKGSVQGIFPMAHSGAGIRLTTAKFYSPNGNPICQVGVKPDIVVSHDKPADDSQRQTVGFRGESAAEAKEPDDVAFGKAIEVAREQVAMR